MRMCWSSFGLLGVVREALPGLLVDAAGRGAEPKK